MPVEEFDELEDDDEVIDTPEVIEDQQATVPYVPPKRKPGRPSKNPNKIGVSLPKPPAFQIKKPQTFVEYWKTLNKEQSMTCLIRVYRLWPVINNKQLKPDANNDIDTIPGEDCFFGSPDEWEDSMLHRYGSGWYQLYLNQDRASICRVVMKTRQDLENHPPKIISGTLVEGVPDNAGYIQYLKDHGIYKDNKNEENDMQIQETINKLTDTVIAQASRLATPVPQQAHQPSLGEKLTFETAKSAIDMITKQAEMSSTAHTRENNPLELVNALVSVADKMSGRNNGSDETTKLFMADALKRASDSEERNSRLIEKLLSRQDNPATQPKTLLDQMREMAEMRSIMKDAFGAGAGDDDEEKSEGKSSIAGELIKQAPQLLQMGLGMWGQFNQSLSMMARMKELETIQKTGQVPNGVAPPSIPATQTNGAGTAVPPVNANGTQQGATSATDTSSNVNPDTNLPYTPDELEAKRQELIRYQKYHGFIATISQPLITHLNDEKKDGYDFADWFIAGNGRLMYDQVKSIDPDELMGAIKSYTPLWSIIAGAESNVKEFIGEFLTRDQLSTELDDNDNNEGDGTEANRQ